MPDNTDNEYPDKIDPISIGPLIQLDKASDVIGLIGGGLGSLVTGGVKFINKAIGKSIAKKVVDKIDSWWNGGGESNPSNSKLWINQSGDLILEDANNEITINLTGNFENDQAKNQTLLNIKDSFNTETKKVTIESFEDDIKQSYSISEGDNQKITDDKNLIPEGSKIIDKNGNEILSEDAITVVQNKDGNNVTIISDDIKVQDSNGNDIGFLSNIVEMGKTGIQNTINFFQSKVSGAFDSIYEHLFSDKEETQDADGNTAAQRLVGSILADIILGKDFDEVMQNQITQFGITQLVEEAADKLAEEFPGTFVDQKFVQDTVSGAMARFAIIILTKENMDGTDYAEAAGKALASEALADYVASVSQDPSIGSAGGAAIVAAVMSLYDSFQADSSMNSDQYKDAGTSAAAAAASAYVGHMIGTTLAATPLGPVGYAIGYVIGALFYNPVKNNFDDKIDGHEEMYDGIEDIIKGESAEENLKQILKGLDDYMISSSGRFIRDFAIGAYNLFGGSYGQTFGEGEFPDPYAFLKSEPKEDGSGNTIYGVERDGVVAFAREYYHDDIIGTNGNDILVGRNGTNLLVGNDGDDLIEGRGDTDQIVGGNGNDTIEAGNENDYVQGDAGNDVIYGDGGDDILLGGTGNDIIYGGQGGDRIEGNEGDDIIYGQDGDDIITAGEGNNVIEGGNGDDTILGEDGDDNIDGGTGNDTLEGNAGNDIIVGNDGNDGIRGGDGDDEIYGNKGIDTLYGDIGRDIINGGEENDLVFGGIGNDIVYGGTGDDALYGEIGNDYVLGGEGNDIVDGFDGDDVLFAGKGNDTLDGGRGLDTFVFRSGDGQDTITDTDGANDVIKFTDINSNQVILTKDNNNLIITFVDKNSNPTTDQITITDQLLSNNIIETLEFADGKKIDVTALTTNPDNSTNYTIENYSNIDTQIQSELAIEYSEELDIDTRDQINTDSTWYTDSYDNNSDQEIDNEHYNEVQWRSYKAKRSSFGGHYTVWYKYYEQNLRGTDGNDRLVGNWWSENLYGEGGDDQLYGNNGNDVIYGQDGNDYINGGGDNDTIYGGDGFDKIEGGAGIDNIYGENDNDTLYGDSGNDNIYGGNNDDFIDGGQDNDTIEGNSGSDTIFGKSGHDNIKGGEGIDLIIGNDGSDIIEGNEGNDTIHGRSGNDIIDAGQGDDYVSGGADNDTINGEDGNDILYGNGGADVISGGSGNDNIYGGSGDNFIRGDNGNDTLIGGGNYDKIEGGNDNDTIFGKSGGDELYGNSGNDVLSGGYGNDILTDGVGNDNLIGGEGKDIFVVTKNENSSDVDTVEDFNKDEDRVIIKVDYKIPITFAYLQSKMSQNGSNAEINFDNGQKIIIKDTLVSDLTIDNIAIGLAGGQDNDIMFGTDSNDILFGENGNDEVYGGSGNDEIWGGKGTDALYGEEGNDILKYEADGKFLSDSQETLVPYGEQTLWYTVNWDGTLASELYATKHPISYVVSRIQATYPGYSILYNGVSSGSGSTRNYYENEDISYKYSDNEQSSSSTKEYTLARGQRTIEILGFRDAGGTTNYAIKHYFTKNFYNNEQININGYNRSFDSFDGGNGSDILLMTEGNDMLALDDSTSVNPNQGTSRLVDISLIYAGEGDDIINLTSQSYTHDDLIIYGGNGNDRIWSSIGDDVLFGQSGNDEIYGGSGNDFISGGDDNDILIGGNGNDTIEGGNGDDQILGESGDDIIEGGVGADVLDGGEGSETNGDTVSYSTSSSGVVVNIANNTTSGGDAEGDTISNLENITGSNFADNLTGDDNANIIEGKQGDDTLSGGLGADTYIYNIGDGNDTINDGVDNHGDQIKLCSLINKSDLLFEESADGNDLIIKFFGNDSDSIIIKNQLSNNDSRIEEMVFDNGVDTVINLENKTIISEEDANVEVNLDELEQERILNNNIVINAISGLATYNEDTGLITYAPNKDFNGIEQLSYDITDNDGNVIRSSAVNIMISAINDNPFGTPTNQEVMVDTQFSINLNDFFSDVDGDNLAYMVNIKDQIGLPHWLTLNESTGELSGVFGRDGKVTLEVSVSDGNGGIHSSSFNITSNVDLSGRVINIPDLEITNGSASNDRIEAKQNQQDLISAGAGDDEIVYVQDNVWQDTSNENFYAWNTYSGDLVSVNGKLQSFDSFDGGTGNDTLTLTDGNDVIFLDDPVTSALSNSARISGIEIINGGLGDDIIDLSSLNYDYGDVELNGGAGDDVLWSNSGDDTLNGGDGNDNLQAGTGNDILNGDAGDDVLKGHDGDETLTGGTGADTLTGGFGFDSFNFTALNESTINQSDLITDFTQGEDFINFSNLRFTAIQLGEGDGTILGYTYDQENDITTIEDSNSDFAVQLSGKIDLADTDFSF